MVLTMFFGRGLGGGCQVKAGNKARAEPFGGGIPDCERDEGSSVAKTSNKNHRKPAQTKICPASAATNRLGWLLHWRTPDCQM